MWKAIKDEWEAFKDRTGFRVGSGSRLKFWKDRSCGTLPGGGTFLELFIAFAKDKWVPKVWAGIVGTLGL